MSSGPSGQRRRSPDDNQKAAALSPWHLIGLGLLALLGTGILAALDRSHERAATLQNGSRAATTNGSHQIVRAADRPASTEIVQAIIPASTPAPTAPSLPSVSSAEQENRRAVTASAPAAIEVPVARAAVEIPAPELKPTSVETAPGRTSPAPEGPQATSSLSPAAAPSRSPAAASGPQNAATGGSLKTNVSASTDCLPDDLRAVLADVAAKFGSIAVVSTEQLNTANHSSGSIREKLHHSCKAVDIRPDRERIDEIKTYLRGRREIGGLESYRNGIIHIDVSGTVAGKRPRSRTASTQTAATEAVEAPAPPPQPTEPPSFFAPVVPPRYQ